MSTTKDQAAAADQSVTLPAEPGATLPVPEGADTSGAPTDKQVQAAAKKVSEADQAVIDAEENVRLSKLSPAERELEEAKVRAGDLRSKHYDLVGAAGEAAAQPMTVADAKVLAVVDAQTSAGDWRAQKFGNDPANPQLAPGVDPTANLVKLSRKTPDIPGNGLAYTAVPKEMVGDYERAGWNRA